MLMPTSEDLIYWRRRLGIKRAMAAELLSVTPRTIRNWEAGTVPRNLMALLERATGVYVANYGADGLGRAVPPGDASKTVA